MSAFRKIHGFGLLAGFLLTAGTICLADMELVTYYPPAGLPDPFRVKRLTVGVGYLNTNNVPAESMIIGGPLGLRTSTPDVSMPVDVGPRDGANLGGAVRLLGAGTNPWFYLENNTGTLRFITPTDDDLTTPLNGSFEKIRVLNDGSLGIFPHSTGLRDPRARVEIGPRDGNNAGGAVLWAGAINGTNPDFPYFQIENNMGQFRLAFENGANPPIEALRILNNGSTAVCNSGAVDPADILQIGAESGTVGGRLRLAGAGTNLYAEIQNVSGDCQFWSPAGGSATGVALTTGGALGIGTVTPAVGTALQVADGDAVIEGDLKLGGVVTTDTLPGVRIQTADNGSAGFLTEPTSTSSPYGFFYQTDTTSDLVIGDYDSGSGKLNRRIVGKNGSGSPLENGQVAFGGDPKDNYMFTVYGLAHCDKALIHTMQYTGGYVLTVVGGASATGAWNPPACSIALKTDVVRLNPVEERTLWAGMTSQPIYRYRLKQELLPARQFFGVLAEETPRSVLDDHQSAICIDDYVPALIAVVKAQQAEIEQLRGRIERLKKLKGGP